MSFAHVIPFGAHKGQPLPLVPGTYLTWLLREVKLSSGLRAAVAGELRARGLPVPAEPPPPAVPACGTCPPGSGFLAGWRQQRDGRRTIRAECARCRRHIRTLPTVEPFVSLADRSASATALLDVLVQAEDLGVPVVSDGAAVWLRETPGIVIPPSLRARVRECSHSLALMIGNTARRQEGTR